MANTITLFIASSLVESQGLHSEVDSMTVATLLTNLVDRIGIAALEMSHFDNMSDFISWLNRDVTVTEITNSINAIVSDVPRLY